VAVRLSWVPGARLSLQSVPQEMPAGELVTVPEPEPLLETESEIGVRLKVAVTEVAVLTVHVQVVEVPEQAPLQPVKVEPAAGVAVRLSSVPGATLSVQSVPQEMPAGELVTVPEPEPVLVTVRETSVDVAEPLTPRETTSPPAVKLTLPTKVPAAVGANRTATEWLAPAASEKLPPDTTVNGAPTLTEPEMLAMLVFCTVKLRSAVLPTATSPKLVAVVGVTEMPAWAAPLTEVVHPLSLPTVSTADTRAKYVIPALSPTMRLATTSSFVGVDVGDDIVWNDGLGQAGAVVSR
jgi:hypothetical protein